MNSISCTKTVWVFNESLIKVEIGDEMFEAYRREHGFEVKGS